MQVLTSGGGAAWGGITGTLSNQTDLQTALDGKQASGSYATGTGTANGTNTGDQTSIAGITGTLAQFNTALTGADFSTGGGTATGTNTGDQTITLTGDVTGTGTGSFATAIKASVSLTTPILGVATGTSLATTGDHTTSAGKIGYATGAGGTVTQLTNKSTGVTLNKACGAITMNGAALAAAAEVNFTVTDSVVAAGDVILANHASAGTFGAYAVFGGLAAAGSFRIMVGNMSAGSLSEAIVIGFCVIKGVTS